MHFSNILSTAALLFTLILSTTAHPNVFSPNLLARSELQKRCPPFDPAGVKNIGNGAGTQFIGGQCLSAADCASGCCANPCGICSGLGAQTQAGKTGCGFGGATGASTTNTSSTTTSSTGDDTGSDSSTSKSTGSTSCSGN